MKDSYSVIELLNDESFHRYVMAPDSKDGRIWVSWLENHPQQGAVVKEAWTLLTELHFNKQELTDREIDQAWDNVMESTCREPTNSGQRTWLLRAAASVSLLILAGLITWIVLEGKEQYETGFGEVREVILEDGTYVQLNANSRLSYNSGNMQQGIREVYLDGEAYFEVSHFQKNGQASSFLVHTSSGTVQVLGTSFNVHARRQTTKIVLESGSVKFETRQNKETTLSPGDMLEYYESSQALKLTKVDPQQITAWRDRKIYFDNTPLLEFAKMLEDIYGKKVVIQDKALFSKKLSGEISVKDMDKVLTAVSRLFSIKIIQQQDTLFFETYAEQ